MSRSYQELYSWQQGCQIGDESVLSHADGAISCAFTWDGIQTSLKDQSYIQGCLRGFHSALSVITDLDITIENHYIRDYSDTVVDEYLDYGNRHMVRQHDLGQRVRCEMAEQMRSMAMKSQVICVLTVKNSVPLHKLLFGKKVVSDRDRLAKRLLETAHKAMRHLKGSRLLSSREFESIIWATYHRDRAREVRIPDQNNRFKLNQRLATKPVYEDGLLRMGKTYTKLVLLIDYPDADQNWFHKLARMSGIEIHVSQILQLADRQQVTRSSTLETKKSLEAASTLGGEDVRDKVNDHNGFRAFLSKHNLTAYKNCYIIKLHSNDKQRVLASTDVLFDLIGKDAIEAGSTPELCFAIWRYSQIAQGHLSRFMRIDHSLQVVNMAPIITFNRGNKQYPQAIRLDNNAQAITYGYSEEGGNHTITGAKTGAGKGVDMVCEIAELYPLGIDFYIIEVGGDDGGSYEWIVEAYGGQYFDLNTDTVVSPFPEYSLVDHSSPVPLDRTIAASTIEVLMPLISKGRDDIYQHIESVAIQLLNKMYSVNPSSEDIAPTMGTFFDLTCDSMGEFEGVRLEAARVIRDNLDSFLLGIGSRFRHADSIKFDAGIIGLNFKNIMSSPDLAKFLLVFISMRFKQIAFSKDAMVRIAIDELDSFIDIDKNLMKSLMKQLARKGRKSAGAMHAISQEALDADLEDGILNQVSTQNLMYIKSGHKHTAEIFKMSKSAYDVWTSLDDPESIEVEQGYREGIKILGGDAYHLHLKFPKFILNLGNTSKTALRLKREIGALTHCPFKRLEMLEERLVEEKKRNHGS